MLCLCALIYFLCLANSPNSYIPLRANSQSLWLLTYILGPLRINACSFSFRHILCCPYAELSASAPGSRKLTQCLPQSISETNATFLLFSFTNTSKIVLIMLYYVFFFSDLIWELIHSSIHLFIQQIFIVCLVCVQVISCRYLRWLLKYFHSLSLFIIVFIVSIINS